jgi:hypothetical protein
MKSKPQSIQQEVRGVLTEREVLRLLATDRETLEEFLRRKVIRAWAYLEPREDFFPLQHATTVGVIESRPETQLHYAEFVLTRQERAVARGTMGLSNRPGRMGYLCAARQCREPERVIPDHEPVAIQNFR